MATRVYLLAGWREWLKTYLRFCKFNRTTRNMAAWGRKYYGLSVYDNMSAIKQLAVILLDKQEKGKFKEVKIPQGTKIKSKPVYVDVPGRFGDISIDCKYAKTVVHNVTFETRRKNGKDVVKCQNRNSGLDFYETWEWKTLRYKVLKKYGAKCMLCGRGVEDGVKICVDHIKPRALFPELELEESNLQVLCNDCNMGKGRWDDTDWRKPQSDIKTRKAGK